MRALHHVGITVKDLDASIRFYHDVLGLEFANEPSPWFEGDELSRGVGVAGATLSQVSLLAGDTIGGATLSRFFAFELVSDREVEGGYVEEITGIEGAHVRLAHLSGYGHNLELLEYRSPPSGTDGPLPSNDLGASHVAFAVDDIEATKAELEAKGIEFYGRVNTVDDGVLAGWRWVYFEDPDGYPLELVEVAYYRDEDRRAGITAYLASRS